MGGECVVYLDPTSNFFSVDRIAQMAPPTRIEDHQVNWKFGPNFGISAFYGMKITMDNAEKRPIFSISFFSLDLFLNSNCLMILKIYHTPNKVIPKVTANSIRMLNGYTVVVIFLNCEA